MLLSLVHLCAQDAECIAPLGANLSNHRYEQAALSVSAHLLEVRTHLVADLVADPLEKGALLHLPLTNALHAYVKAIALTSW